MVELRVATLSGRDTVLQEAAVKEFKTSLRGELLAQGDAGYDEARQVWNGMIDKRPALIARCTGVADVINCVNFARDSDLLVSVRGGGHNVAGHAVCDGGIMIDLSRMKGIRVDPAARTARAEAGVRWAEFDRETQVFGLATTGGAISDTGIAGLTLGGGLGWLQGKFGMSVDNLLSVDVVTADGRALTASASENQDLFWALRGGSGNFGIVTSFEYRVHPVGPLLAGMVLHPIARAREVLEFYREFSSKASDELSVFAGLLTSLEGDSLVGMVACYNGPIAQGERALEPLRRFGQPIADTIGPTPYTQVQTTFDDAFVPRAHNYWKVDFVKGLSDEAMDTVVAYGEAMPSPHTVLMFVPINGAASRVDPEAMAYSHRRLPYQFGIYSRWLDPAETEKNVRWTREFWTAMRPFYGDGVYVNEMSHDEGDRIQDAYGKNYRRLVALKKKYDPANLFRHNQNIKPAT